MAFPVQLEQQRVSFSKVLGVSVLLPETHYAKPRGEEDGEGGEREGPSGGLSLSALTEKPPSSTQLFAGGGVPGLGPLFLSARVVLPASATLRECLERLRVQSSEDALLLAGESILTHALLAEEADLEEFLPEVLPRILVPSRAFLPAASLSAAPSEEPDDLALAAARLFWSVASWSAFLSPLENALDSTRVLGLRPSTSRRAQAFFEAFAARNASRASPLPSQDGTAEAAAAALQEEGTGTASHSQTFCRENDKSQLLPPGVCPRLAALRAVAFWSCCGELASSALGSASRVSVAKKGRTQDKTELRRETGTLPSEGRASLGGYAEGSLMLLSQLRKTLRDTRSALLAQQRQSLQTLRQRQSAEMEAACAQREQMILRESDARQRLEERPLGDEAASREEESRDAAQETELKEELRSASAAVASAESLVAGLVQQHVGEIESLERHWKHEQQVLRREQVEMFKDVAVDLFLLQHAPKGGALSARESLNGDLSAQLVLPPLPSTDESGAVAASWKLRQEMRKKSFEEAKSHKAQGASKEDEEKASPALRSAPSSAALKGSQRQSSLAAHDLATPAETLSPSRLQLRPPPLQQSHSAGVAATPPRAAVKRQVEKRDKVNPLQQTARGVRVQSAGAAAAALSTPVFDIPRLLQREEIFEAPLTDAACQHSQSAQPGFPQRLAKLRLLFGSQQRRAVYIHLCSGNLDDFLPNAAFNAGDASSGEVSEKARFSVSEWLSSLQEDSFAPSPSLQSCCFRDEGTAANFNSWQPLASASGGEALRRRASRDGFVLPSGEAVFLEALDARRPSSCLAGAVFPVSAESLAVSSNSSSDRRRCEGAEFLFPSLEEQRAMLRETLRRTRGEREASLSVGDCFVSRHSSGEGIALAFHVVVSSQAQPQLPLAPASLGRGQTGQSRSASSSVSSRERESLSVSVQETLRRVLAVCDESRVATLVLPALMLESAAAVCSFPFVSLQQRLESVLRLLLGQLRSMYTGGSSAFCVCPNCSKSGLTRLVLLLPPASQSVPSSRKEESAFGEGQWMRLLQQAALSAIRSSAHCC